MNEALQNFGMFSSILDMLKDNCLDKPSIFPLRFISLRFSEMLNDEKLMNQLRAEKFDAGLAEPFFDLCSFR